MESEKKTIMNGITAMILLLVIVVAGIIILNKKTQVEMLTLQNENLNTAIVQRDSLVNELTGTFDEIEENLTFVRNKRSQLILNYSKKGNNAFRFDGYSANSVLYHLW